MCWYKRQPLNKKVNFNHIYLNPRPWLLIHPTETYFYSPRTEFTLSRKFTSKPLKGILNVILRYFVWPSMLILLKIDFQLYSSLPEWLTHFLLSKQWRHYHARYMTLSSILLIRLGFKGTLRIWDDMILFKLKGQFKLQRHNSFKYSF